MGRTYAPCGQTPVLRSKLTCAHLSAISAVTPEGELYLEAQTSSIKGPDVIRFVDHLLEAVPGKLLLVWDGNTIHRSKLVQAALAEPARAERIQVERLPAYAPELNPDEGVWRYLKHVELKNVVCSDLLELKQELHAATERLKQRKDVLSSCIRHAGL